MNRDLLLELRILSGIHAGARVLLPESAQVLGSAAESDLILSDEGVQAQHALLTPKEDGSVRVEWLAEDAEPLEIAAGHGFWLGPVQVAIERIDAPWRTDLPMVSVPHEDTALVDLAQGGSEASDGQPAQADTLAGQGRSRTAVVTWTLATILLAALGGGGLWGWQQAAPPAAPAKTSALAPRFLDPQQVADTVATLALAGQVRIEVEPDRGPVVRASFLPDEQAEALALALSRLSPRPGLRLVSQQDVQSAVSDLLQLQPGPQGATLNARYLGEGRFRIEGRVADPAAREALLARLAQAAPDARGFESALSTDAEAATAMLDELHALGIDNVSGHWSDGVLHMKVRMEPAEVPRWEHALMAAATRHDLRFRAILELAPPRLAKVEPLPPAPAIRSIVGGAQPYVMLADGNKLMVDGRSGPWRLVQVAASAVVFETAQGRQLTVER